MTPQTKTESAIDVVELRRVLHDMSNLLTGILVHGGLLAQAIDKEHRLHRYADEVCEGGERASALVREARAMLLSPQERLNEGHRSQSNVIHDRPEAYMDIACDVVEQSQDF